MPCYEAEGLHHAVILQALEAAFAQFGPVAKAVVVADAHANASRRLVALQYRAIILAVSVVPLALRGRGDVLCGAPEGAAAGMHGGASLA